MATPPATNPFDPFTDDELAAMQLSLALGCGRAKAIIRRKHRIYVCTLFNVLQDEAERRGRPRLVPPYTA